MSVLPCGLVLALSEFPLEYLREFLCAFAPSLQGACAYPTLPHNPPSFSKINLTFYTCFFFGFVCLSFLVRAYSVCCCSWQPYVQFAYTELAAPTYQPCLRILRFLQILQPACLVGLCYFVLPWPYLGPVWGLSPFWRRFALLVCSWSCPFLGRLAPLSSYAVLLPCLCLFACIGWVHCVCCVFCMCCAVV